MTMQLVRFRGASRHATVWTHDLPRYLSSILLAGYGIFILSLYFRGVMTWYINPTYVGPATAAGVLLVVFAIIRLRGDGELASDHADCSSADSCGCGTHESPKYWTYGILALPLLLGFLVPPHSLAAFSARQRGPQIAGLSPIPSGAPLTRVSLSVDTRTFGLQDWIGALSTDPNPRDFQGKPVILTGMVIHNGGSLPAGYMMVLRYQVTCCIADAKPEGLMVRDTSHGALQDNQWVTVTGAMRSIRYQGQQVVAVEPRKIARVKAGNPYMY
ncbi:MAG: TIGR03943 family protein [Chloroflexota bacterium]